MKKALHTFIFSLFTLAAFAQIQVEPQNVDAHFDGVDISDIWEPLIAYVDVTNQFDHKVELKWVREISDDCISGWKFQCCDNVACYPSHVNTNYDETIGQTDTSYVLQAGETHKFSFYILPQNKPGCCTGQVTFATIQEPDNILATIDLDMKVNDPQCVVSTNEALIEAIQIYPNPVQDFIQVTDNQVVEFVRIFNTSGVLTKEFEMTGSRVLDVNDLESGAYFVVFEGKENEVLKTERIIKF